MPITRLNHAVLYVRDADRAATFYEDVLGFHRLDMGGIRGAVFMQARGSTNDHDLGLFTIGDQAGPSEAGRKTVGLYHLAWEVDTLDELERLQGALSRAGALVGASDHGSTKSLYGKDIDGVEFEIAWIVPLEKLDQAAIDAKSSIRPLDIAKEKARYGAHTKGGLGVSLPVA